MRLDTPEAEQRVREGAEVLVVVDRVAAADASRGRLTDAVATAFSEGEGVAVTLDNGDRRRFSEHPTCSSCGTPAPALVTELAEAGVLCASLDDRTVRFVTHLDVDSEAVDAAVSAAGPVLSSNS